MKTFQILNDALIYSIITSEQYIKLEKNIYPEDWYIYRPDVKLRRNNLLRYYIFLMETGIYRSERDLKIYNTLLVNDSSDDDEHASAPCFPCAS